MEPKDKQWESGPNQSKPDDRTEEQITRAAKESERRKQNLEDDEGDEKEEGSYKEKNGGKQQQYDGDDSTPDVKNKPTHPQKD